MHKSISPLQIFVALLLAAVLGLTACSNPSKPDGTHVQSDASLILPKQEMLDRYDWWDNRHWAWYKRNIPFFDSPDSTLNATYYYRWEVLTKHLTYGDPETGYTFTEFIDRPFWSGTYGPISCPLGHQFYEVRWLKDFRVIEDFAHYWFDTPGAEPRSYSNWYGNSMWAVHEVWQDKAFVEGVYPHMQQQYQGWIDERYDPDHEMFMWDGMHDGMETNINSRQTENTFSGGDGYRPTLNSYLYADLRALSNAAALLGDSNAPGVIAGKVAFDQGLYAPLWAVPSMLLLYRWHDHGYRPGALRAGLRGRWWLRHVLPVNLANAGVWIPAVCMIYALPLALQLPMQNLVLCFWSLMIVFLAREGDPEAELVDGIEAGHEQDDGR